MTQIMSSTSKRIALKFLSNLIIKGRRVSMRKGIRRYYIIYEGYGIKHGG